MKNKIKFSVAFLCLIILSVMAFADNKVIQESKIVKVLESNKSYLPIKSRISLEGFSVDENGCITTDKLKSKKFSIISLINLTDFKYRLGYSSDGLYSVEFVLHTDNPKVYFLKRIEGLEQLSDYYKRLEEERLVNQRIKNARAGLGAITDDEVVREIEKNKASGLGAFTDAQIAKQVQERELAEMNKNKLAGLGNITDAQVVNERNENKQNGLGDFTDYQINEQRAKNKKIGYGEISDAEVATQKDENRKKGFGNITDYQLAEKQKKLGKAKEYEEKKMWINALVVYYDYMEENPTAESIEALHRFDVIAEAIRSGNPGLGDFDYFSMHDGWKALYNEYKRYCSSQEAICGVSATPFRKEKTDFAKQTVTYSTNLRCKYSTYSYKFKTLESILNEGYEKAYKKEWQDLPGSINCSIVDNKKFAAKFIITDLNGNNITGMEYTKVITDNCLISVSGKAMGVIDSGEYIIKFLNFGYADSSNVYHKIADAKEDVNVISKVRLLDYCENGFVNIPGKNYEMQKTEMPQWLYEFVMGENPSKKKGDSFPVDSVSWYDAVVFCNRLSELVGLEPAYTIYGTTDTNKWYYKIHNNETIGVFGDVNEVPEANGYRLPKKEEWVFAAKGGKNLKYSGSNVIYDVAWYDGNSRGKVHACGSMEPNGYGLYDMSGNVSEWCYEFMKKEIVIGYKYQSDLKAVSNPGSVLREYVETDVREVPVKGFGKYCLGGNAWSNAEECSVTNENARVPNLKYKGSGTIAFSADVGFRVVRNIK